MKVSIITPTYNSELFIDDTLKSIKKQSYRDIEHIVCDNYSDDHTKEICARYENRFIQKSDNSMYEALNNGIVQSTGDIISFLNSDDVYADDDVLERVVNIFSTNDQVLVLYGKCRMSDANLRCLYTHKPKKNISYGFARKRLFIISHPSVFFRKEIFKLYGFYDLNLKIMADFEYWLRLLKNEVPLTYCDKTLAVFRRHTDNLSLKREKNHEIQYITEKYGYTLSYRKAIIYQIMDNLFNFNYLKFQTKEHLRAMMPSSKKAPTIDN